MAVARSRQATRFPASYEIAETPWRSALGVWSWSLIGDLVIVIAAVLAVHLAMGSIGQDPGSLAGSALILVLAWLVVACGLDLYDQASATRLERALPRTAIAALLAAGAYGSLLAWWSAPQAGRSSVPLTFLAMLGPLVIWKTISARWLASSNSPAGVLLLGRSRTAAALADVLRGGSQVRYQLVAHIAHWPASRDRAGQGERLVDLLDSHGVRYLIVDPTAYRSAALQGALLELDQRKVSIVSATEAYERLTGRVLLPPTDFAGLGYSTPLDGLHAGVRRLFDVAVAAVALVIFALLLLLAALAIRVDSSGSVLYDQERIGRHGRKFRLLKLRTMALDAEADGRAVWARDRDPRVTRVGALLRRARLDEIPQLWNVLVGEMSLIGPRPERPEFVELLAAQIPMYQARHLVAPGITGWAQVQYKYGSSIKDAAAKLEYDLYYIRHRSLLLDLTILLKTLPVMLGLKGV